MAKDQRISPTNFKLLIVTPDEPIFEDTATRLIAPGIIQDIAILPDHTPLYSELQKGDLEITLENKQVKTIPIDGGILRAKNNQVTVITGF